MLGEAAPGCEKRWRKDLVRGCLFVTEAMRRHMLFTALVNVLVSFKNFSAAASRRAKLR